MRSVALASGLAVALVVATCVQAHAGVPALIDVTATDDGQVQVGLQWAAEPDVVYDVRSSTNLVVGDWYSATNMPIAPTNLIGELRVRTGDSRRFYRVQALDTQGPIITARYPATNGVGWTVRHAYGVPTRCHRCCHECLFAIRERRPIADQR